MTGRPDDPNPEPPGGRAAQRLREFLEQRMPHVPDPAPKEAGDDESHGGGDTGRPAVPGKP
jgi:hypothetical protein